MGTLNAGLGLIGIEPQSWITEWPRNTFMLILVGIWMWVGFATVILSAGLKGISTELLEAARMDGATELQVFFRIILPLLAPTVAVVGTTIVITALKTFDIVYVMTNGQYRTEVIGTAWYHARFTNHDAGTAAAIAIILLLDHHPGDADQHPPLPGAGGHPMTDSGQPAIPVNLGDARVDAPPRAERLPGGGGGWFSRAALHAALIIVCLIWLLPTVSLFVSSLRPANDGADHRLVERLPAAVRVHARQLPASADRATTWRRAS